MDLIKNQKSKIKNQKFQRRGSKIHFYNYLTRKIERFKPIRKNWVFMYCCGPTVYDFVHLGNLRTYLFEDFLRRTLEYNGYKIKHIVNITDIDDKIIKKSRKQKINFKKLTKKYSQYFFKDLKELNIKKATKYPRATQEIPSMIKLIQILLKKGYAYKTSDGIYFEISKFKDYGKLSQIKKVNLISGKRISTDQYDKKTIFDFALWKFKKVGEPFFKAPFGDGRPGWHIECSAMSTKYLGTPFDIHCGGIDLLFPHHENEIAQSEGAFGKKFVNFFIEGEHLLVEGQKMAKSLGNIYTLKDLKEKNFLPLSFRYLCLQTHWQTKLDFSFKKLEESQKSLFNLWQKLLDLLFEKPQKKSSKLENQKFVKYQKKFLETINFNLNTKKAIELLYQVLEDKNLSSKTKLKLSIDFDKVFGLSFEKILKEGKKNFPSKKILSLVKKRENLRKKGDFKEADKIREKIQKNGYQIEDTKKGTKIKIDLKKILKL